MRLLRACLQSIWLLTVLVALILGIWLGIFFAQKDAGELGVIAGWTFFVFFSGHPTDFSWHEWVAAGTYPLAMLGYSMCAYLAIRRRNGRWKGLLLVLIAACISTGVSVQTAVLLATTFQPGLDFVDGEIFLTLWGILVLVHLGISALLGWLIALGLIRRHKRGEGKVAQPLESK
jgi:hypothetical protein